MAKAAPDGVDCYFVNIGRALCPEELKVFLVNHWPEGLEGVNTMAGLVVKGNIRDLRKSQMHLWDFLLGLILVILAR